MSRAKSLESLIYVISTVGHRQSYLDTLGPIFGLEPVSGRMSLALFSRLVAADRLLFASLDDDMVAFTAVAAMRSLRGRPTVALFLRAQKCFETGRWYYTAKRQAFRALRHLPRLTLATITPFDVAPRYAEVAHLGVFDPQYWDLHDGKALRRPGRTALTEQVLQRAMGRCVLCALGSLTTGKGLEFLAETLERHPRIAEHTLVVCAGRVSPDAGGLFEGMKRAGALIIDRFITDQELESLYGIADGIWACYPPDYDQASGVFGRAVQLGVLPIVRQGSVIASFAKVNGVGHLPVAFGAHDALADMLSGLSSQARASPASSRDGSANLVGEWRRRFIETLGEALKPASSRIARLRG